MGVRLVLRARSKRFSRMTPCLSSSFDSADTTRRSALLVSHSIGLGKRLESLEPVYATEGPVGVERLFLRARRGRTLFLVLSGRPDIRRPAGPGPRAPSPRAGRSEITGRWFEELSLVGVIDSLLDLPGEKRKGAERILARAKVPGTGPPTILEPPGDAEQAPK